MDVRQARYFTTVAEEGSFTAAAELLAMSQPGLSTQIRALEKSIGHVLLERSGRPVRLTDAGAALLPFAQALVDAADAADARARDLDATLIGTVSIGSVATSPVPAMFDFIQAFTAQFPAVRVTLVEDTTPELLDRLDHGRLDLAVVGSPAPLQRDSVLLADEPLAAFVPEKHHLSRRRTLDWPTAHGAPVITLVSGTGTRTAFDSWSGGGRVDFEVTSPATALDLARRGLGVAYLPASLGHGWQHVLRLVPHAPAAQLHLVWSSRPNLSPAARRFIADARIQAEADARAGAPRHGPGEALGGD